MSAGRLTPEQLAYLDTQPLGRLATVDDDVLPPWRPRGIEIRGRAEALDHAPGAETGLIRLFPERVHAWGEGLRRDRPDGR